MTLSEPQLISPLLDGFAMGDAISYHHGIQCCPAMRLETSEKYIVKIISVPASQARLDALLLAGAFADSDSALDYFRELADGIAEEAGLLQKLARFEGFVSYEDWQVVPMEYGTGFDIYLLGAYRPTLQGQIERDELTHLGAVNLGLDLCAALSVARRFGHIYADLQPGNVFVCGDREYRIGDLGFINLESLDFASLPDKYHSNYTPPEIKDAYSALNTTLDTYAVGMILYQAYNEGHLPPVGMPLPAPKYADAQLSEIILKACDLDPQQRWEDPMQMGQALISYLQSNSVNDVPIVPPAAEEAAPEEETPAEDDSEPSTEEILAEVDEALVAVPLLASADDAEQTDPDESGDSDEVSAEKAEESNAEADDSAADAVQEEESSEQADDTDEPVSVDDHTAEEETESPVEAAGEAEADAAEEQTGEASSDAVEALSEEAEIAEETSSEEAEEDDVHEILAQADDIISHELPTPVIELQQIELVIPVPAAQSEEAVQGEETELPEEAAEPENSAGTEEAAAEEPEKQAPVKKRNRGLIAAIVTVCIVGVLVLGGFLFYENYYLQVINDIVLSGYEDQLTVTLDTDVAYEKLTVICTDTYGNSMRRSVTDGTASFDALKAGTTYKLQVRIEGFHKLLGETTESYTTAQQTTIGNLVAATGPEDGSVILSFTVQGPDSNQWNVSYQAQDEEAVSTTFTGHMVTLNGLSIGKEYTFTITPVIELYVNGTESITYTPRKIVIAENLQILGIKSGMLQVAWTVPEDAAVSEWTVRCYNDSGFDQTITTAELTAAFNNIDSALGYTVEVTADAMTVGTRTYLSANSVTVFDVSVEAPDRNQLKVLWNYECAVPAEGWLLLYTVDGSTEQKVVKCDQASGIISPLIPGAHYSITIQPANGASIFGGSAEYDAPQAQSFSGYGATAEDITFKMCITPDVQNWDSSDVPAKNYTTSFKVGTGASFVMRLDRGSTTSADEIITMYVIRNSEGKIVSNATESRTWKSMWYRGSGKLTLPFMPEQPGTYTVSIYFNGTAVLSRYFEVIPA